ncbi:MAG: polysaccharide deacetylase [Chlorobiaceae bacterium]|nr:polysaccharide deacetylase [Chlorobiaceae bacterium]
MVETNEVDIKIPAQGNPRKIKVLMYHLITDNNNFCRKFKSISLPVESFRSQIKFLERWGFTPITFEDYQLYLEGELNLPKKPIILTFDDGYEDIYKYVYPIMKEYGMKGVLFITADRKVKTSVWDAHFGIPQLPLLNNQQIIELHAAGFEIGSHSISHPQLPHIPREKAWEEISRSRMILEILLNNPVKTFAYPYGLTNDTIKHMTIDAGYNFGCGTYTGPPIFGQDHSEIRRMLISGSMPIKYFALRMLTPYQYCDWTRWKIKTKFFRQLGNDAGYPI